jgi:hypothetical protein
MLESRGNMGQRKSEHRDFKKSKERTWDRASLRAKTLRAIKETWDRVSLRKETLKNRKEERL